MNDSRNGGGGERDSTARRRGGRRSAESRNGDVKGETRREDSRDGDDGASPDERRRYNHMGITAVGTMKNVHQLNSVDGMTYQSVLPQQNVGHFGLFKAAG